MWHKTNYSRRVFRRPLGQSHGEFRNQIIFIVILIIVTLPLRARTLCGNHWSGRQTACSVLMRELTLLGSDSIPSNRRMLVPVVLGSRRWRAANQITAPREEDEARKSKSKEFIFWQTIPSFYRVHVIGCYACTFLNHPPSAYSRLLSLWSSTINIIWRSSLAQLESTRARSSSHAARRPTTTTTTTFDPVAIFAAEKLKFLN